jgi:hypothetical protein
MCIEIHIAILLSLRVIRTLITAKVPTTTHSKKFGICGIYEFDFNPGFVSVSNRVVKVVLEEGSLKKNTKTVLQLKLQESKKYFRVQDLELR